MKLFDFKFAFVLFLPAFQIACGQTQNVQNNNQNNSHTKAENAIQTISNSTAFYVEEKKKDVDYFTHLKPEHKKVLQEWLKTKSYLRPAIEEIDSILDKSALGNVHKNSQTQFYTVADINKDGKEDFAVLLIDTCGKKDKFALAIFNGNVNKGHLPNYFEENLNGISNSNIEYINKRDNYFSSDSFLLLSDKRGNGCVGFIPNEEGYKAIVCI